MRKLTVRAITLVLVLTMLLSTTSVFSVTGAVGDESLNLSEATLYAGENIYSANKAYLQVTSGAPTASWSSGDEKVATVSQSGKVTAVGLGVTTVTAVTENGSASCKIEVLEMPALKLPTLAPATKPPASTYPQNDSVHDPEFFYVESEGLYYMLCTHNSTFRSSPDLINWTNRVGLTAGYAASARAHVSYEGNYPNISSFWAPDIIYNPYMERYLVYYSVSNTLNDGGRGFGNKCSAIGMTYLEPIEGQAYSLGTLNNWKDGGIVVKSYDAWRYPGNAGRIRSGSGYFRFGLNNVKASEFGPNAIDPAVFFDKAGERMFMVYGSFYEGMFILELNPMTGLPFDQATLNPADPHYKVRYNDGICVANRGGSYAFAEPLDGRRKGTQAGVEGPTIFYNPDTDYYYLMVSYDYLDSTYNVRIGRSKTVEGPYYDYNGFNMVTYSEENLGRLNPDTIFTNNDINTDPGFEPNPLLGEDDGMLKIETLSYDPNVGTKILAPYMFAGGQRWVATGHHGVFKAADGEWVIGSHAKTPQRLHIRKLLWTDDGWPMASPARYAGESINQPIDASKVVGAFELAVFSRIRPTGTASAVTGVASQLNSNGTVTSSNAAYNGTWRMHEGNKIDITLDGVTYKGQVAVGWDWDNWDGVEFVFSGLSNDGTMLWGKGGSVNNFTPIIDEDQMNVVISGGSVMQDTGSLRLSAEVTPAGAAQGITWSVESGGDLVAIDAGGLVRGIRMLMGDDAASQTVRIKAAVTGFPDVYSERVITVNAALRAYYKLNGNLNDSSAYKLAAGTVMNGAAVGAGIEYKPFTPTQSGVRFLDGGSAGSPTYISLPNNIYRVTNAEADEYTISIWVKPESPHMQHTAAVYARRATGTAVFTSIQPGGGTAGQTNFASRATFQICNDNSGMGGHRGASDAGNPLEYNQWHHLVGVYQRSTPGLTTGQTTIGRLYVNGVLVRTVNNFPNENTFGTTANVQMWLGLNNWDPSFKGTMAEFRFFSSALSDDQVKSVYDEQNPLKNISFTGLSANGTPFMDTTSELTLTFSQAVEGLTADNIIVQGASKGLLTGSGPSYKLSVSDIQSEGATVTVSIIPPEGLMFTPDSLSTVVHKLELANFPVAAITGSTVYVDEDIIVGELKANIVNYTGAPKNALAILVIYDPDGRMLHIENQKILISYGPDNPIAFSGLGVPVKKDLAHQGKLFLWNPDTMVPIAQAVDFPIDIALEVKYPSAPTGMTSSSQYRTRLTSVIHDNEFYLHDDGYWYTMWTNTTVIRRSLNLLTWENVPGGNRGGPGNLSWAPCIIKLPIGPNGADQYAVYESRSSLGSQNSRITLWKSNNLINGYTEIGTAVVTGTHDGHTGLTIGQAAGNPNAIDADVLWDKDGEKLWMTYGSWFGGLFIVELDPATGLCYNQGDPQVQADPLKRLPGKRIVYRAGWHRAAEGPDIIFRDPDGDGPDPGWYYLTVAYDSLDHTYNTRIARSRDITGPYLDYNGNDINNTTITGSNGTQVGTLLVHPYNFTGDIGWTSTAHGSMIYDPRTDEYFVTYNNRPGNGSGSVVLGVRKVFWTDDGWPLTIPAYFTGLDNPNKEHQGQKIPAALIAGRYEVIRNTRIARSGTTSNRGAPRIASEPVTLNIDGTVSGAYAGTWQQVRGDKLTMTLRHGTSDFTYDLYLIASWDFENWRPTIYFTGYSGAAAGSGNDNAGVLLQGKLVV